MPVSWPPVPAPRRKPAVDTVEADPGDPAVFVGHDGRTYKAHTLKMIDLHLRNITKRIATVKSPETAELYREDRDRLLDMRLILAFCSELDAVASPIGLP